MIIRAANCIHLDVFNRCRRRDSAAYRELPWWLRWLPWRLPCVFVLRPWDADEDLRGPICAERERRPRPPPPAAQRAARRPPQ